MKNALLILLLTFLWGCNAYTGLKDKPERTDKLPPRNVVQKSKPKKQLPTTVDEAVDIIFNGMDDENKQTIRSTAEDELSKFHFGLGLAIRNNFALWAPNSPLLKDTGKTHADDASSVIIKALWKKLQKE